jgi:adenylosuccinate lyase
MRANVEAQGGYVDAERVMLELAQRVGSERAHELVHRAALAGQQEGLSFAEAMRRYLP